MLRELVILGVVIVILARIAWAFQRRLIYFPDSSTVVPARTLIPGAADVVLRTADGLALGAWLVPAEGPDRGVRVLVASGNGGDRSIRAPLARALAAEGLGVLLFDYRGYGGNPGSPSEAGLARDVRAARDFLVDAGTPANRIVYLGESLGSAVVTELAAERPPGALLLRSPFVDLASVGKVHYPFLPVRLFLRDRYRLTDHLAKVQAPVTVVYGSEDSIVPPAQSRAVAEAAPRLRRLVEVRGAEHNSPALLDGADLVAAVVDLADHISPPP